MLLFVTAMRVSYSPFRHTIETAQNKDTAQFCGSREAIWRDEAAKTRESAW